MIVKPADGERYIDGLPARISAVLIYGPDQGLVSERSERVIRTVVTDIRDPFRVSQIDGPNLLEDKARLAAEAAALSFSGERRVVRVSSASNGLAAAFDNFLEHPTGDALIVVEAGDLPRGSSLRRVFEEADNAAALVCYPDSPESVAELLGRALREHGIKASPEAISEAVPLLGGDRGTIRRQIDKLLLYAKGTDRVQVSDIRAIIGDESEARLEEVCDATGEGDPRSLDRTLERLWSAGVSPVAVIRMAIGHFQRLALVQAAVTGGESPDAAARRLRLPVHFARMASLRSQLRSWNAEKLAQALDRLLEAELLCKSTAVPGEAACGQALFHIAALARLTG
ncbi:MAG TPA: DNA polymerase III subunit delta [Rhizomicrobium sp.]|nr:DNA polymerase III subunit delta [Rhizomicrobium sp.]